MVGPGSGSPLDQSTESHNTHRTVTLQSFPERNSECNFTGAVLVLIHRALCIITFKFHYRHPFVSAIKYVFMKFHCTRGKWRGGGETRSRRVSAGEWAAAAAEPAPPRPATPLDPLIHNVIGGVKTPLVLLLYILYYDVESGGHPIPQYEIIMWVICLYRYIRLYATMIQAKRTFLYS